MEELLAHLQSLPLSFKILCIHLRNFPTKIDHSFAPWQHLPSKKQPALGFLFLGSPFKDRVNRIPVSLHLAMQASQARITRIRKLR
jgi:hypothetical protein